MATPEVVRCYDGHFQRVIYGISPYIADYQEQVTVACIVQGWCGRYVLIFLQLTLPLINICVGVLHPHTTFMVVGFHARVNIQPM